MHHKVQKEHMLDSSAQRPFTRKAPQGQDKKATPLGPLSKVQASTSVITGKFVTTGSQGVGQSCRGCCFTMVFTAGRKPSVAAPQRPCAMRGTNLQPKPL